MKLLIEILKLMSLLALIIFISKYVLVMVLRKFAENLNLKPQIVGEISGYATSVPELITVSISSFSGLVGASIYNIISSNVINLVQYLLTIFINKNQDKLKNKAILFNLVMVILTIVIPIIILYSNISSNFIIVPIFIILYLMFRYLNNRIHKLYLKNIDKRLEEEIEEEKKLEKGNKRKTIRYIVFLIATGIILFFIGNILGNVLENLADFFGISQFIIGILLGVATSIPEFITFLESQKHHKKKENNMIGIVEATNNLFISNLVNLFIIQSIGIVISSLF